LPATFHVIPGNHDRRDEFRRAFADQPYLPGGCCRIRPRNGLYAVCRSC
jgi:hypothetical protein